MTQDSHAGVAIERVLEPLSGFARAVGDDGQARAVAVVGKTVNGDEIGAGGTLLGWIASGAWLEVCWCVLSATGARAAEAKASAAAFLPGAASTRVVARVFPFMATSSRLEATLFASRCRGEVAIPVPLLPEPIYQVKGLHIKILDI